MCVCVCAYVTVERDSARLQDGSGEDSVADSGEHTLVVRGLRLAYTDVRAYTHTHTHTHTHTAACGANAHIHQTNKSVATLTERRRTGADVVGGVDEGLQRAVPIPVLALEKAGGGGLIAHVERVDAGVARLVGGELVAAVGLVGAHLVRRE